MNRRAVSDEWQPVSSLVDDYTTSRFHTSLRAAIGILEGRPSVVEIMSQGPEFDARSR